MRKTIAVLTKSSKNKGFCVAGIDVETGEWIRLISKNANTDGAISEEDMRYKDGDFCVPLDVINVEVKGAVPSIYQPENYLIDDRYYWEKCGECSIDDILSAHPFENDTFLYGNTEPYIDDTTAKSLNKSLVLIEVSDLAIHKIGPEGNQKTKASFMYNGRCYNWISVTDPLFYNVPDLTQYSSAYLIVSLPGRGFSSDKFDGVRFYKFVAKIFLI